jgi:hypothetical protein
MISIKLNSSKTAVSTRINTKKFKKEATEIFNSVVKKNIIQAKTHSENKNFNNCNNPI